MAPTNILRPETKNDLDARLYLSSNIYNETAKKRFDALDSEYVFRKGTDELFPIIGNYQLSVCLTNYLNKTNITSLDSAVKVLDIGAAGGALTSIFVLDALLKKNITNIELHLVDVAKDALNATLKCEVIYPVEILSNYNISEFQLEKIKNYLQKAHIYEASATNLPDSLREMDIVVSGFTHHHMNLRDKLLSCQEMLRVTKKYGFIGISDEHLTLDDYQQWYNEHSNEMNSRGQVVPIAMESFIDMNMHIDFFNNKLNSVETFPKSENQKHHYTFAGVKK